MGSLDLPEIRARLAANGRERRQTRGALRALRTLLANQPPRPLLSPPSEPPRPPTPRRPSPELELLGPGAEPAFEVEVRRTAFGRRTDGAAIEDDSVPLLLTPADSVQTAPPVLPFVVPAPREGEPSPAKPFEPQAAAKDYEARKLLENLEDRLRREREALETRAAVADGSAAAPAPLRSS